MNDVKKTQADEFNGGLRRMRLILTESGTQVRCLAQSAQPSRDKYAPPLLARLESSIRTSRSMQLVISCTRIQISSAYARCAA